MAVSPFVWLLVCPVVAVVCLRVYLRRTVYCRLTDRLDCKTVLITGWFNAGSQHAPNDLIVARETLQ